MDNIVEITSLCFVDTDGEKMWLYRIADIVNGKLQRPYKTGRMDNYFENRDRLYRNDGPAEVGSIGVWDWTAIPSRDNPGADYVQTFYAPNKNPVRVVFTAAKTLDELGAQLVNGKVHAQPLACDTLFCCVGKNDRLTGLLCKANEYQVTDKHAKLKSGICVLPYYTIHINEIFNCGEKHPNMQFLRDLEMGAPRGHTIVGNPTDTIRNTLIDRLTWPFYKEYIGGTKAEWKRSRIVLERITDSNLYASLAEKLKCTPMEAKAQVDKYIAEVAEVLDTNDIDADTLARITMHHDGLRAICEEAIATQWKDTYAEEISRAGAAIKAQKQAADKAAKDAAQKLEKAKKELASVQTEKARVLSNIADAEDKQKRLLSEIQKYEELGNQTIANIQNKIADAQKNVAGFLADISMFMPHGNTIGLEASSNEYQYRPASFGAYTEEETEEHDTWQEECRAIADNLVEAMEINEELSEMLTAFLYAAHINKFPVLIAGPAGQEIAETVAVSMFASSAGQLRLSNSPINDLQKMVNQCADPIVFVENMFARAWDGDLPSAFVRMKKAVIWTHPYAEDLGIEPAGLFNYMLPVCSECFISTADMASPLPSKRADNFKAYVSGEKKPLKLAAFKQLKMSKLQFNQLTKILSDAKAILEKPNKEKDMEVLFGILPRCVIDNRLDILKDLLSTEKGLSETVKAEIRRYIEG